MSTPTPAHAQKARKLRLDLVPVEAIVGCARAMQHGVDKGYPAWDWVGLDGWPDMYYSALLRHLLAWRRGEAIDPESGLSHLDHVLACAAILRHRVATDGAPPPSEEPLP